MANEGQVKEEALQIIKQHEHNLPSLVVFDLDYSIWPFFCCFNNKDTPHMYPDAKGILEALNDCGVNMAIASRCPTRDRATTFLEKLGVRSMFVAEEIFSSWTHKTEHFLKIQKKTGVAYESMLFFDDEDRNVDTISKIGVTCVVLRDGINLDAFRQGISRFSQQQPKADSVSSFSQQQPKADSVSS